MTTKDHDDVRRRADRAEVELVLFSRRRSEGDLDHREMLAEMQVDTRKSWILVYKATKRNVVPKHRNVRSE